MISHEKRPSTQFISTGGGTGSLEPPIRDSATASVAVPGTAKSRPVRLDTKTRTALAKAVVEFMKHIPQNNAIAITQAEVYSMLEQNTPYKLLCENLKKKGLDFHEVRLAQFLDRRIPGLSRNTARKGLANSPRTTLSGPPTMAASALTGGSNLPGTARYRLVRDESEALPTTISSTSRQTISASHHAHPSTSSNLLDPSFGSGDKEEFPSASIQHNTLDIDPREQSLREHGFSDAMDLTPPSNANENLVSAQQVQIRSSQLEAARSGKRRQGADLGRRRILPTLPDLGSSSQPTNSPALPSNQWQEKNTLLARPINKKDAVKRRNYDPNTVARDILIASGIHPSEEPLNLHMASLLGRFINIDSDLSTLDWDKLDPGGPPVPNAVPVEIPSVRRENKEKGK